MDDQEQGGNWDVTVVPTGPDTTPRRLTVRALTGAAAQEKARQFMHYNERVASVEPSALAGSIGSFHWPPGTSVTDLTSKTPLGGTGMMADEDAPQTGGMGSLGDTLDRAASIALAASRQNIAGQAVDVTLTQLLATGDAIVTEMSHVHGEWPTEVLMSPAAVDLLKQTMARHLPEGVDTVRDGMNLAVDLMGIRLPIRVVPALDLPNGWIAVKGEPVAQAEAREFERRGITDPADQEAHRRTVIEGIKAKRMAAMFGPDGPTPGDLEYLREGQNPVQEPPQHRKPTDPKPTLVSGGFVPPQEDSHDQDG